MPEKPVPNGKKSLALLSRFPVPAIICNAGEDTIRRFVEFFTANIRNRNTRLAYHRAVCRFSIWVERKAIPLSAIEPVLVAGYIEELRAEYGDATVKQHLAAIRMMFDYLVTGGALRVNPAASVRGPKVVVTQGKTPVLSAADARHLLDSIDSTTMIGLRDRALIGVMVFTFARVSAAVRVNLRDIYRNGRRYWIRLHEKGGRFHTMPLNHLAEQYLVEYMDAAGLHEHSDDPLFRTIGHDHYLRARRMHRNDVLRMIKRRARNAGLSPAICCHTFRATGITEYMRNGGTLEKAQKMAAHVSSRTTNLYNRALDNITLDEVERVLI